MNPNPIESPEERAAFLAIAAVFRLSNVALDSVLTLCGTWTGALKAPAAFLGTCGLKEKAITLLRSASVDRGFALEEAAQKAGATILLLGDPGYPQCFLDLDFPPRALYCRGDLGLFEHPCVAVVGSRDHTSYGVAACRTVVTAVAQVGLGVVSGMARGIDGIAHRYALKLNAPTIGVLGTGIDIAYPRQNLDLYDLVAQRGLLLTELPPGAPAFRIHFPWRNRLIARLSQVVVIVEAAERSGAQSTGAWALEHGMDVMVVPGPINSRQSIGSNSFLRDGATPFLDAQDLWGLIPAGLRRATRLPASLPPALPSDLSPAERLVADAIDAGSPDIDEIAARSGLIAAEVAAILLALELRGLVSTLPGRRYQVAGG